MAKHYGTFAHAITKMTLHTKSQHSAKYYKNGDTKKMKSHKSRKKQITQQEKQLKNKIKQTNTTMNNSLVFTTAYSPYIKTKEVKQALTKHWCELTKDNTLKHLFPEKPIIAYKRNTNISDTLINAKIHKKTHTTPDSKTRTQTQSISNTTVDILASLFEKGNAKNTQTFTTNRYI